MALGGFLELARAEPRLRPEHPARPDARGRLRARPRRGPQRARRWTRCSRPTGSGARRRLAGAGRRGRRRPACARPRWRSSPSWSSPTSTSCPPRASPATPTSWRRRGRVRERYRERLGQQLVAGASPDDARSRRPSAPSWTPPATLTAVLLPPGQVAGCRGRAGIAGTLRRGRGPAGAEVDSDEPLAAAAGPRRGGPRRRHLLRALDGRHAVVGPARPLAAGALVVPPGGAGARPRARSGAAGRPVDTEEHLAQLVAERRPRGAGRPAGPGPRAAGRAAAGERRERLDRDAAVLAAAPGPPRRRRRRRCTCTRRRCATAWASCASCTATGSTTRSPCWS